MGAADLDRRRRREVAREHARRRDGAPVGGGDHGDVGHAPGLDPGRAPGGDEALSAR